MTCYDRGDDSISQILNVGHIIITIVDHTQKLKDVKDTEGFKQNVLTSLEKCITGINIATFFNKVTFSYTIILLCSKNPLE